MNRYLGILLVFATVAFAAWAKEFLAPLAVAALGSFLVAPAVTWLEQRSVPKGVAVFGLLLLFHTCGAGLCAVMLEQGLDLANRLPAYEANLRSKLEVFKSSGDGPLERASRTFQDLAKEMQQPGPGQNAVPEAKSPVPVTVIEPASEQLGGILAAAAPLFAPFGYAAAAMVCAIFFLLQRADIRDRFVHLLGGPGVPMTIDALEEASERVSGYLVAQFLVNCAYGIPTAAGLYLIGIPNALLWGMVTVVLRFLPYIGPWISFVFPFALSLATTVSWVAPMLTILLYVVLEVTVSNWIEPWLYGSRTGLTPTAVVVAALFWTWLWGPLGLLLATPLTVCLAVFGRSLGGLSVLALLLEERVSITPGERLYQRWVGLNREDALELITDHEEERLVATKLDTFLSPALVRIAGDLRSGTISTGKWDDVRELGEELIEAMQLPEADGPSALPGAELLGTMVTAAATGPDELLAEAIVKALGRLRIPLHYVSAIKLTAEVATEIADHDARLFCISAIDPFSMAAVVRLVRRTRLDAPEIRIWVILWPTSPRGVDHRAEQLKQYGASAVFTSYGAMERELIALATAL